jgi:hypothetical protein
MDSPTGLAETGQVAYVHQRMRANQAFQLQLPYPCPFPQAAGELQPGIAGQGFARWCTSPLDCPCWNTPLQQPRPGSQATAYQVAAVPADAFAGTVGSAVLDEAGCEASVTGGAAVEPGEKEVTGSAEDALATHIEAFPYAESQTAGTAAVAAAADPTFVASATDTHIVVLEPKQPMIEPDWRIGGARRLVECSEVLLGWEIVPHAIADVAVECSSTGSSLTAAEREQAVAAGGQD